MFINSCCWNAHSLSANYQNTKIPELSRFIEEKNLKLICISETWLTDRSNVTIPHFYCYRTDRSRGGVCIFIHKSIPHKFLKQISLEYAEAVQIKIHDHNRDITVSSIYCSPSCTRAQSLYFFDKVLSSPGPTVIAGDFNAKHNSWNNATFCLKGVDLFNLCNKKRVNVHPPDGPTCTPPNGKPSAIDFVLSKSIVGVSPPIVTNELSSDHMPLIFKIPLKTSSLNDIRIPNYAKANWKSYRQSLNNKFSHISQSLTIESENQIESAVTQLEQAVLQAAKESIPLKLPFSYRHPFSSDLQILIAERNFYRRKFVRQGDPSSRSAKNQLNRLIRLKTNELNSIALDDKIGSLNVQDLSLFAFAKKLKNKTGTTPPLKLPDGTIAYSSENKAQAFAAAFEGSHNLTINSFSKKELSVATSCVKLTRDKSKFPSQELIKFEEIVDVIKSLKIRKAPGPDNITNTLIRNFPKSGILQVNNIFNACLELSHFPTQWKIGKVIAIPKPDKDKKIPSNHRPISLLSNLGKIFERLVLNRLEKFEKSNKIFTDTQFGFRNEHSTIHQVLRVTETAAYGFNSHKSTGVVTLDVEKAFDTVWHSALLHKLMLLNFPIYLVKIVEAYLKDRKSYVFCNNSKSSHYDVRAGVPQGSILAPFLFNIYINDIKSPKNCKLATYADDTLLFCQFSWKNIKSIKSTLERGLNNIQQQLADWKIKINASKTEFIVFSRSMVMPKRLTLNPPSFNGEIHEWKKKIKYLGVTCDSRLTFQTHIDLSIAKANKIISTLFCIFRKNSSASVQTKLMIYKAYIRPILVYAGIIVHNCPKKNFGRLQIMQNKCLRMALSAPYYTRTTELHREAKIPYIDDFIAKNAKHFYERAQMHDNPLISPLGDYANKLPNRIIHKMPRAS